MSKDKKEDKPVDLQNFEEAFKKLTELHNATSDKDKQIQYSHNGERIV